MTWRFRRVSAALCLIGCFGLGLPGLAGAASFAYDCRGTGVNSDADPGVVNSANGTLGCVTAQGAAVSLDGTPTPSVPSGPYAGTTQYTYDSLDRVTTSTQAPVTTTYTYNSIGQMTTVVDPGRTVTYTYDSQGQPVSMTEAQGSQNRLTTYEYDALDRLIRYTYDTDTSSGGDPMIRTTYTYDAGGRLETSTYDPDIANSGGETLTQYVYDALDRLIRIVRDPGSGQELRTQYTYDDTFNRVTESTRDGDVNTPEPDIRTRYTYDALNRLIETERDGTPSDGNPGIITTYQYDPLGRLAGATDPEGNTQYQYTSLQTPEPGTLVLLAVGLLGMAGLGRRRAATRDQLSRP